MDEQISEKPINEQAWIKVWHPLGLDVRVQFTGKPVDWAGLLANVNAAFAAGWLANAPSLADGEEKQEAGYAAFREVKNKNGTGIRVDLYPAHDATKYKFLHYYLDNIEQVQAFENASGMKVAGLKRNPFKHPLNRGDSDETDSMIHRVIRPFAAVYKLNPKFNPDEKDPEKKEEKYLFVRYEPVVSAKSAAIPQAGQQQSSVDDPPMTAEQLHAKDVEFTKEQARKAKIDEKKVLDSYKVKDWIQLTDKQLLYVRNRAKEILDQQF